MRLGIVDLDTSHPQNWIPIERELGHEVVGLWDSGAIHPAGYAESFAAERGVPNVYLSLDTMLPEVDCVVIHGCNWDTHVEKARPFVEAGKPVLLDKPLAGCMRDLNQIQAWADGGARISGGSSLRFCAETAAFLELPEAERGRPHTVFCGCGVDEFNYGIHAYAMLSGIMGPGIERVRHLGSSVQRRIEVTWRDGRQAMLAVGKTDSWLPFHATVVTERSVFQYRADPSALYRALLYAVLPYLAGITDVPPVPMHALMEPELCALAARRSWMNGDRYVLLDEMKADEPGYDGAAFAAEYRKLRYPDQK